MAGDRRGAIAILFGFLAVPLLGTVGLAIDYGQLLSARSLCQTGADAAALYASGVAKTLIQQSDGSAGAVAVAFAEAKSRAEALFNAHLARVTKSALGTTVTLTKKDQGIIAEARFNIVTRTHIGSLFGVAQFRASGTAKSFASMPLYTDLYMALDNSQSMGLAATPADAVNLFNLTFALEKAGGDTTPGGCVFGCHVAQTDSHVPRSYQSVAADAGIKLRIDVLREAVRKTIATAQSDAVAAGTTNYRIALYGMGLSGPNASTYGLTQIAPLSVNWSALQSAAAGITLGPNNGGGTGDSFLAEPLADLRGRIPASGDGSTQAQARAFLFIITDGLRDVRGSCWGGHCTAAFDPAACQTYKDANITVGVIYTTYLPILKNPNIPSSGLLSEYQLLVQPHAAQIAPNLRACASPGWYAEASDGPSIDAALARMFDQTTLQVRLTD